MCASTLAKKTGLTLASMLLAVVAIATTEASATGTDPYRNFLRDQLERDRFQVKAMRTQIDVLRVRLEKSKKSGDRFSQTDSRKELRRIYRQESLLTARIEANQALIRDYAAASTRTGARTDRENRAGLVEVIQAAKQERKSLDTQLAAKSIREADYHQRHAILAYKLKLARAALSTCTNCKGARFGGAQSQADLDSIEDSTLNAAQAELPALTDEAESRATTAKAPSGSDSHGDLPL